MQPLNPATDPQWDARMQGFPEACAFHTAGWAEVLRRTYRLRPAYFVEDAGGPRAVLPLMEASTWLTGRRGVSLPFTDRCPALAAEAGARARVLAAAMRHGATRRWRYLECRGETGETRSLPASTSYHGHTLSLEPGGAALFAHCAPATRRSIRKALRNGLQIEFASDLETVRRFYRLHCATRKRHGLPPQPFRFFRNLQQFVLERDQGWVVLALVHRQPVAGAIFLRFGGTVTYKFGASDPGFTHLRPNNLVMWESILRSAESGHRVLDFGRTSLEHTGLRQFKLSWGARESALHYYRYELPAARVVAAPDRTHGWYNGLFRHLPSTLLRTLGAALYRHTA